MFISILTSIVKSMMFFTGSYSNNMFPEPLPDNKIDDYIKKMQLGNKEARNKLIEHNLRLVAHIVKKYETSKDNTDDLISIGTIGLIKAIDSFSNQNGAKLTTYAARCIENEILMNFRSDKKTSKNVSLNEPISYDKDGNEFAILDMLKTDNPDYIEEIHTKNNIEHLKKYLTKLTSIEQDIITKRYGLNNTDEYTQKQIANQLGISRSYVSRIEKRAVTKMLREFIKEDIDL